MTISPKINIWKINFIDGELSIFEWLMLLYLDDKDIDVELMFKFFIVPCGLNRLNKSATCTNLKFGTHLLLSLLNIIYGLGNPVELITRAFFDQLISSLSNLKREFRN